MKKVLIFLFLANLCLAQRVVKKWDLWELSFSNPRNYANPFQDVSLLGEFTHAASGRKMRIYGFYDGDNIWRLRFMPDEVGEWRYEIYFSDSSAKRYRGSFKCVASNIKGPLRVNPRNPLWFSYADGTPFYLFAAELDVHTLPPDVLEKTLDFLQKYHFNAIMGPHVGGPGGLPWQEINGKIDFSRYDLSFWRRLDEVLLALKRRNMFLFPFSIFGGTNEVPKMPPSQYENFIRYWTARWSGFYNATFQPTSEWEEGFSSEEVLRILELIKKHDPWKRLLSIHSWDYSKRNPQIYKSPFYDYFTLQDKLTDWNYAKYIEDLEEIRECAPKPIFAQECLWEGNIYQKEAGLDVDNMRRAAWTIALNGGHIGYGDEVSPPRQWGGEETFSVYGLKVKPLGLLYPYLKFLYETMTSIPWWEMEPAPKFVKGKNASCLKGDKVVVVYLPEGKDIQLNLPSGKYKVTCLDPVNRRRIKEEIRKFEGAISLSYPGEVVLIFQRV